ncbi:ribulose-1,5 bisphosphate carboxylase/oxygenase large subunit N-methyltransferase, chloroplastic isoform X2 [Phalaenopsis equestris]|nr:ribulose-1,5 bisphosphate carboxylase/oxygenase large subunit N-methyltransferase, chloroplastic isoform X2 [Phalaenopsis equestris]XP_020583215.1 ribulose-1,5 bisphosphate carboxylase/oxygenase large subunit N-methyltransferase, chloroplastic isoform X2 [Phalaenopsis equestris]
MLNDIVGAARILYLNDVEIYFIEDDDFGPFSQINELKSLNAVLQMLKSVISVANPNEMKALNVLQNETIARINSFADQNIDEMVMRKHDTTAEDLLLKWGESCGARSKVTVAYFEGANRGAVAREDIDVGESALEIPESIIISEDLVRESDMFKVLKEWDGMTTDTMLLLWSMRERYNPLSNFKYYFQTLPETFNTGLSFGIDALTILHGTLLFEELMQAKAHLRQQYDSLCPALCASYPDIFKAQLYSWDHYLWACELWYSNGMKVIFSDGKLRTCLIPIAGLLNHSLFPHILHYGRVDSETKVLKFQLARKCRRGEQCYLSYGSFSGSHLIMFYGFLPNGDNPYDIIPLDFEVPETEDCQSQTIESFRTCHMVRGSWFSKNNKLRTYGLSPLFLAHLRSVLKSGGMEQPPVAPGEDENETALLETIISIFEPMMEGLGERDDLVGEEMNWDVKLALEYKELQRRIISSVLSCAAGLKLLDSA